MSRKSRTKKSIEYATKYGMIPVDDNGRLSYMYDLYKITEKDQNEIFRTKNQMIEQLRYYDYNIKLFEDPEGSERPRTRLVNRYNLTSMAKANSSFIQIYSPCAKEDSIYMKRLLDTELDQLDHLICTPCIVDINVYIAIPKQFNGVHAILAELGLIRPIKKPDWDNTGKKYTDMLNLNVWIDDDIVIDGAVHKYYSILPRIEINIRYLNMFYNKYQYDLMKKRKHYPKESELSYFGK